MNLLIISIPLFSSFFIYFFGRYLGHRGGLFFSIFSIIISTIISIKALKEYLIGKIKIIEIKEWFEIGQLRTKFELIYDKESIIMCNLISIITMIVIIYSYWYLESDPHLNRFISKLLLFSVSMYILVSSKNYLFSFFGWELVGIVSYLLINFWSISIQNNKCAIKAIIFNKIGDIFYLLALLLLSIFIYSFDYLYINSLVNLQNSFINKEFISLLSLFFLLAAMAKSAQIFLHCWLGDAMAGPTPVSALLHAATMVTAGIFIILRSSILIEQSLSFISIFIQIIGTLTILFAGLSALNQYDIKKIIAYSTCAQIGFMFFTLGIFKPLNGSLYHLVTHGFFKALLFLSAGLLIHSFILEQDLRKYGSFIFTSPLFYIFFFIGSLAIIGFPGFSGFYSKDLILIHSLENNFYSYFILLIGSLLSSFYSYKILYFAFYNKLTSYYTVYYSYHYLHNYSFLLPFLLLLFGSILFGFLSSSFFSSPELTSIDLEYSISNLLISKIYIYCQFIPFLFPFITLFFLSFFYSYFSYFFNSLFLFFSSFFNRKFLFDSFYNSFLISPILFISYHCTYKILDRGYLEYLGPVFLFRLFFYFPSNFNLSNQFISNLPYLFFYFFLSFFFSIFLF